MMSERTGKIARSRWKDRRREVDGWMDRWMDGWIDGWTWMDGWMDGWTLLDGWTLMDG